MHLSISDEVKALVPSMKIGFITYENIVVETSPQMIRGRFRVFQESIMIDLDTKKLEDYQALQEWRSVFKTVGTDPSRYRHSAEALYRRLKKKDFLPDIHSAVDLNNMFSLQYQIPFGIYDLDKLSGPITMDVGKSDDEYEALNNRTFNLAGKLHSKDAQGPFGSPISDSKRTAVTTDTKNAVHIIYLQPSMSEEAAFKLVKSVEKMFTQIHGGQSQVEIVT